MFGTCELGGFEISRVKVANPEHCLFFKQIHSLWLAEVRLGFSGLALALAFTSVAQATPVDWTADLAFTTPLGRTTVYNNSLIGTFTYDADTSTLSNVNLVLTYSSLANNLAAVSNLVTVQKGQVSANANQIDVGIPSGRLNFNFTDLFSNAGGVVNLTGVKAEAGVLTIKSFSGTLTGVPQATATAVPEPEAYAMMLAGLGLVGFAARRKQQAA